MHKIPIKKGVFLIPCMLTCMNIFCGFYAIIASFGHQYYPAAIAIILAMFFDVLDGRVARMTHTTSEIGLQLDSLADAVSFCIAPAVLSYVWALTPFGRIGWMAAFLFVICGILRLARFNLQTSPSRSRYFIGLPTPAAAGFIATLIIVTTDILSMKKIPPLVLVFAVYLLAFLMISNIKYRNFKDVDLREKRPFGILVFVVLTIYVIETVPQIMLFLCALTYTLSGPMGKFLPSKRARKSAQEKPIKPTH